MVDSIPMALSAIGMVFTAWMQTVGFAQQPVDAPARAGQIDTSLCEIAKAPLSFHHRLVRIDSYASGWGIDEPPMLYDPECPGSTIFPDLPIVTNDYQLRRLQECFAVPFFMPARDHALWCLSIKGTFVGEVEYWLTTDGENEIRLKIHEVPDLVVGLSKKR